MTTPNSTVSDERLAHWAKGGLDIFDTGNSLEDDLVDIASIARELQSLRSLSTGTDAGVRVKAGAEELVRRVRAVLSDLGPGGYLLPAGAGKTNALEAACNEVQALLSALEQQPAASQEGRVPLYRRMEEAPKDGSMLRLFCRFDGDSSTGAFEDADEGWTIGTNNLSNTGEDLWEIVGWDWEHDTFRQAHTAVPLGWLPFHDAPTRKYKLGDMVTKTKGSSWTGRVVGFYSTKLTPIGYAVESTYETGSVQIYPESALALVEKE